MADPSAAQQQQQQPTYPPAAIAIISGLYKRQRPLDILMFSFMLFGSVFSIVPSKLFTASLEENIYRLSTPIIYTFPLWFSVRTSDDVYRKWRNTVHCVTRCVLAGSPVLRHPNFMMTRLQVEPSDSWRIAFIQEPIRIITGSNFMFAIATSLAALPLRLLVFTQLVTTIGIRTNAALCTTQLLSSPRYSKTIVEMRKIFQLLYDNFPTTFDNSSLHCLAPEQQLVGDQPLESCKVVATFLQITLCFLFPIALALWFAPPAVVIGCLTNKTDREILKLSVGFTNPNRRLLHAAGLARLDLEFLPLPRWLFSYVLLVAVWALARTIE